MSSRPVAYIAGPMTGVSEFNHPAFHAAARDLRIRGYVVLNPAEVYGGDVGLEREKYIRIALANLMLSDAIFLLPGWKKSAGARLEQSVAWELKLDIILGSARE